MCGAAMVSFVAKWKVASGLARMAEPRLTLTKAMATAGKDAAELRGVGGREGSERPLLNVPLFNAPGDPPLPLLPQAGQNAKIARATVDGEGKRGGGLVEESLQTRGRPKPAHEGLNARRRLVVDVCAKDFSPGGPGRHGKDAIASVHAPDSVFLAVLIDSEGPRINAHCRHHLVAQGEGVPALFVGACLGKV